MNKKALVVIGLIVLLGFGILTLQQSRQQNQFQNKVESYQESGIVETGNEVRVDISGFAFRSEIIKIRTGTKVVWTNEDSAKHTVTGDTGGFLDSPVLDKGGVYEKVFDEPGVYRYHCEPHPAMLGAIIVVD